MKNQNSKTLIPFDLITASGSGLDPHISVDAARFQVPRISVIRNLPESKLYELIMVNTEKSFLGIFGEERVNVLALNIDLDKSQIKLH